MNYIQEVNLLNIKSIKELSIKFEKGAGWHVLIGENGAGKSTIIKSIAAAIIGPSEMAGIKPNWDEWLRFGEKFGSINMNIDGDWIGFPIETLVYDEEGQEFIEVSTSREKIKIFSAGFGPFRKFTGTSSETEKVYHNQSYQKLAAHLSLFGEDTSLSEVTRWLSQLKFQNLEGKVSSGVLESLFSLINSPDFLPNNTKLVDISSDGVLFEDGSGAKVNINQLSDGFRSILSLTFELLRLLSMHYGIEKVFSHALKKSQFIDLEGIVLIDEVDAHLHPSWQTQIGEWFLKYFPKIQFIVTTHSPFVCRACHSGSIHYIAANGSGQVSREITGDDKDRLLKGNILEAFGTEMFGKSPVQVSIVDEETQKLGKLNMMAALGKISKADEAERQKLLRVHTSL